MLTINCSCGHKNEFDQPYLIHAGFGDQGFLYNDDGNLTLTWSAFDPAYEAIAGKNNPWALSPEKQMLFERALRERHPAAAGGSPIRRDARPARLRPDE